MMWVQDKKRIRKKPVKLRILLRILILKTKKRLLMRTPGQITIVLLRFKNNLKCPINYQQQFVLLYQQKKRFQFELVLVAMPPVAVVSRIDPVRNHIRNGKQPNENKVLADISARMSSMNIPIENSSHCARKNSKNGGKSSSMHRNDSKK